MYVVSCVELLLLAKMLQSLDFYNVALNIN